MDIEKKDIINLMIDKINNNETCVFAELPKLFSEEIILSTKPDTLISLIAQLLNIEQKKISKSAFYQYKYRLIKQRKDKQPNTQNKKQELKTEEDILNFKFSKPSEKISENEDFIKQSYPSKKNN